MQEKKLTEGGTTIQLTLVRNFGGRLSFYLDGRLVGAKQVMDELSPFISEAIEQEAKEVF